MEVLKIGGVDYSKYIEKKGVGWKRNDLDAEGSGRDTQDATMHRAKITTKRTLSYKLINCPQSVLAALDDTLSLEAFSASYLDLHGVQTRTFYCSSFSATLDWVDADGTVADSVWDSATFTMIEV